MNFSKKDQLKKTKRINPKKMTALEREAYEMFISSKVNGKCQCGCGSDGVEFHHSKRGINKDDRSIILICRECHSLIHNLEYKNIDKSTKLAYKAKDEGFLNWQEYTA